MSLIHFLTVHIIGLTVLLDPCLCIPDGCNQLNGLISVTENVETGMWLMNWTSDSSIYASFQWVNGLCAEYFNITATGLVTKKVIDLENDNFKQSSSPVMRCDYTCENPPSSPLKYKVTIQIDATNEFPPEFASPVYNVSIFEMSPAGTTVLQASSLNPSDEDFGDVPDRYSLQPDNEDIFVMTDQTKGTIELLVGNLDYEGRIKIFNCTLYTYDQGYSTGNERNGSTLLRFYLQDIDDNPPAFRYSQYHIDIQEENSSIVNNFMTTSPRLGAYDQDTGIANTVLYQIISVEPNSLEDSFSMDDVTGQIQLHNTLDRESLPSDLQSTVLITVQAYENTTDRKSASTTVTVKVVDVDDHEPTFSPLKYSMEIPERPDNGLSVVTVTAVDLDEGKNRVFQYELRNGSEFLFVNQLSGKITVKNGTYLDYESAPSIQIEVGTDKSQASSAIVEITLRDINDNHPVFLKEEYEFEINQTKTDNDTGAAVIGQVLGTVSATDLDSGENGRITYSLSTQRIKEYLNIGSATGVISVKKTPLPLEGELSSFDFVVEASDNGQPKLDTVTHVKIVQYGDAISVYLYLDVSASVIEKQKSQLQRNISSIFGVSVSLDDVQPDNTGGVNLSRSRITLTAEYLNGTHLHRYDLKRLTESHYKAILALFDYLNKPPDPVVVPRENPTVGPSEIALIVIGAIVLVAAVVFLILFLQMSRELKLYKSLALNISRRSTVYESQEVKIEINPETSDYDKTESINSDEVESTDLPTSDGNLNNENPLGHETDNLANPIVWNPVFSGENEAENITDVTELKQYYTYPITLDSNESDAKERNISESPRDGASEHTTGDQTQEKGTESNDTLESEGKTSADQTYVNGSSVRSSSPDDDSYINDLLAWIPVSDNHTYGNDSSDEEAANEDDHKHPYINTTLSTQAKQNAIIMDTESQDNLIDSSSPYLLSVSSNSKDPHTDSFVPLQDYNTSSDGAKPPASVSSSSDSVEANPDYVIANISTVDTPSIPEPKPDYNKVSFSDTAIAITENDGIEIIKQPHNDDEDEMGGEDGDESESSDENSSENSDTNPVRLIGNTPGEENNDWEPTGHLDSDILPPIKIEVPISREKIEPQPFANGLPAPPFILDENPNGHKANQTDFFFSQTSTRM